MTPAPNGCSAPGCTNSPTAQWQRTATLEKVAADIKRMNGYRESNSLPPIPDDAPCFQGCTVLVKACDTHKIDAHAASGLHETICTAPPTCNCTPVFPPADPPLTPPAAPAATTPTS